MVVVSAVNRRLMVVMVVAVTRRSMVVSAVVRRLMVMVLTVAVLRRPVDETETLMRSAMRRLPARMLWLRLSKLRPKH
jgi:hypothetical protein